MKYAAYIFSGKKTVSPFCISRCTDFVYTHKNKKISCLSTKKYCSIVEEILSIFTYITELYSLSERDGEMQIQAIESFLMVYETQNLSRASERLYVTQQCLSRQIRALEEELGVLLFVRQKTGMQPTDACQQIYPLFQEMINSYEKVKQLCSVQEGRQTPKLTIALADGLSNYIDVSVLSHLVRETAGAELVIEERPGIEVLRRLRRGRVDIALLLEPFDDTMLEHVLIREDYGCIAMLKTHPLAAESGPLPFAALKGVKTVTGSNANCAAEHLQHYCAEANVWPQYVANVSNLVGFVNRLDRSDIVVTVLSCEIPLITNPNVVTRKIINPVLMGRCHCCYRSGAPKESLLRELTIKIKETYAAR